MSGGSQQLKKLANIFYAISTFIVVALTIVYHLIAYYPVNKLISIDVIASICVAYMFFAVIYMAVMVKLKYEK